MASTTPRNGTGVNNDQTGRNYKADYKNIGYAATVNLTPNAHKTLVNIVQLTGAITINISTTNAYAGDKVEIVTNADGTNRVVTFGPTTKNAGTQTITAAKWGTAAFVFDGTYWVETRRVITT